ncbi:MAG: transposase [Gammaproteobacteria bacterium]|nr:transposase [Gammaproteobacteria bacterium]
MPRPDRIVYEDAIYHVMNRGRSRQTIFHGADYYNAFENTLAEAHQRFDAKVHAYCLMGNHYHLLLQTPRANLARVMRHINGVYTQRYNRLKKTDGPLFRGRYKSILVEDDVYALYVSRYIHRNPIDMKRPIVSRLEDYRHSSYPAYINKLKAPEWLSRDFLYGLEDSAKRYAGMRQFVEAGVDEYTAKLYSKQRWPIVYGSKEFRQWVADEKLTEQSITKQASMVINTPSIEQIITIVSDYYKVDYDDIVAIRKGKGIKSVPRNVAIYFCQEVADKTLLEIAEVFGFSHPNSVSYVTSQLRQRLGTDSKLQKDISVISQCIIDNVT